MIWKSAGSENGNGEKSPFEKRHPCPRRADLTERLSRRVESRRRDDLRTE